jgi:DHA2 family multidrug resistance protein
MTYNDIFTIMGVGTLIVLPLVLFLRPFASDAAPDAPMH